MRSRRPRGIHSPSRVAVVGYADKVAIVLVARRFISTSRTSKGICTLDIGVCPSLPSTATRAIRRRCRSLRTMFLALEQPSNRSEESLLLRPMFPDTAGVRGPCPSGTGFVMREGTPQRTRRGGTISTSTDIACSSSAAKSRRLSVRERTGSRVDGRHTEGRRLGRRGGAAFRRQAGAHLRARSVFMDDKLAGIFFRRRPVFVFLSDTPSNTARYVMLCVTRIRRIAARGSVVLVGYDLRGGLRRSQRTI